MVKNFINANKTVKIFTILFLVTIGIKPVFADIEPGVGLDYIPTVLPPSPTAAELGRYGQIPVGLFTGTPNISIPLYTYKTKNLTLPISLSYNSNGVKVDQIATWVGLGWSLNAGGVVTRTVRGQPDEKFRRGDVDIGEITPDLENYLNDACNEIIDTEPDLFTYNFLGNTGKFVFDDDGNPVTIPFQNLRIEYSFKSYSATVVTVITITTQDGIQYIFGGGDGYVETSKTEQDGQGCYKSFNQEEETAWYLKQIIHPNGDQINFTYAPLNFIYSTSIIQTNKKLSASWASNACGGNICKPGGIVTCVNTLRAKTLHLTEISSPGYGKIIFNATTGRFDLEEDVKLNYISIENESSQEIKSFCFNYEYSYSENWRYRNKEHNDTFNKELLYRMFLSGVDVKDNTGIQIENYSFEYNDINDLPPRLSFSQDYWGYFNGKYNGEKFVPYPLDDYFAPGLFDGEVADRTLNEDATKKGILTKLTYPTGGYNELEYEINSGCESVLEFHGYIDRDLEICGLHHKASQTITEIISIPYDQTVEVLFKVETVSGTIYTYNNGDHFGSFDLFDLTDQIYILHNIIVHHGDEYRAAVDLKKDHEYRLTATANGAITKAIASLKYFTEKPTTIVQSKATGGLRIKSIKAFDLINQQNQVTNYYYCSLDDINNPNCKTSIKPNPRPIYHSTKSLRHDCGGQGCDSYIGCTYKVLHSSPLNDIYNSGSHHLAYEYVTISYGDDFENGGEEHQFHITMDEPPNPLYCEVEIIGTTQTNKSWNSGQEIYMQKFYKNQSGDFVTIEETETSFKNYEEERNSQIIKGYVVRKAYDPICQKALTLVCNKDNINKYYTYCNKQHTHQYTMTPFGTICIGGNNNGIVYHQCYGQEIGTVFTFEGAISHFNVMEYNILSRWNYIDEVITKSFDLNGENPITTTVQYFYDNELHANLTKTTKTNSNGDILEAILYYPEDYVENVENFDLLKEKKITGLPIDERTYNNDRLTSGKLTKYNDNGHPVEIHTAEEELGTDLGFIEDDPYSYGEKRIQLDYDDKSNLSFYRRENDIPVSYIWGYNETLPVAQTSNARPGEFGYSSFENNEDNGWSNTDLMIIKTDFAHSGEFVNKVDTYEGSGYGAGQDFVIENLDDESGYKASVWVNGPGTASIVMKINNDGSFPVKIKSADQDNPDWQLLEVSYSQAEIEQYFTQISYIRVFLQNNNSEPAYFDDVKFYPSNCLLESYTYDQMIGITSAISTDNITSYYNYYSHGPLKSIVNHDDNIIEEHDYNYRKYLKLNKNTCHFGKNEATETITISTNSTSNWEISVNEDWITVNPESGNGGSFEITCAANEDPSERTCTLTITSETLSDNLIITQNASEYLNITTIGPILFDSEGGMELIEVLSNVNWYVEINPEDSWLWVDPTSYGGDNSVELNCLPNDNVDCRNATVKIYAGDQMETIDISQDGTDPFIYSSDPVIYFDVDETGITKNFIIVSNVEWTFTINDDNTWFQVLPTLPGGPGDDFMEAINHKINTSPDPWVGTITFSDVGSPLQMTMTLVLISIQNGGSPPYACLPTFGEGCCPPDHCMQSDGTCIIGTPDDGKCCCED